jgi:phosphoglycerate kinase
MNLRTLGQVDIQGKTVLYRAPYDIGAEKINGVLEIKEDMRIAATLPTLRYLIEKKCKIVVLTYVKRPDGQVVEELRTTPHARKLSELLGHPVKKVDDCIGPAVEEKISQMQRGEILMLENVRFYKEENDDDDEFAKKLCAGKDIVVFDGFPQAMRVHASTTGILRHLPGVAGLYMAGEVEALSNILEEPSRPFTAIIGGAKISDKIDAVNNLLKIADKVLVSGAVANVFFKALGKDVGGSFVEDVFVDAKRREKRNWTEYAKEILEKYGSKIIYPLDSVASSGDEKNILNLNENVPPEWSILDIGPKTIETYTEIIKRSGTVFLAGPAGQFETEKFSTGSASIVKAMVESGANTIIAGGDTIEMAKRFTRLECFSHVSLAGGAALEFLAGKKLPVLEMLTQ